MIRKFHYQTLGTSRVRITHHKDSKRGSNTLEWGRLLFLLSIPKPMVYNEFPPNQFMRDHENTCGKCETNYRKLWQTTSWMKRALGTSNNASPIIHLMNFRNYLAQGGRGVHRQTVSSVCQRKQIDVLLSDKGNDLQWQEMLVYHSITNPDIDLT